MNESILNDSGWNETILNGSVLNDSTNSFWNADRVPSYFGHALDMWKTLSWIDMAFFGLSALVTLLFLKVSCRLDDVEPVCDFADD